MSFQIKSRIILSLFLFLSFVVSGTVGYGSDGDVDHTVNQERKPIPNDVKQGTIESGTIPTKPEKNDDDNKMTRRSWPRAVGEDGETVKAEIEQENPKLKVQILPYGSMVTMDFRTDRVRIFVDGDGKVVTTPTIG